VTDATRRLTPEERRQRNHDEMLASILDAAREVMREKGVADLNLQEIAQRVGMRAPSLYNYFPNRIAIYDALFALGMQNYRKRMTDLLEPYGATWEGLEKMMEGHLAFTLENPELFQLMFERPVPRFVPSPQSLEEANRLLDIARQIASEAIASGTINSSLSPEVVMNLFMAIMHGFSSQHLANEPDLPAGSGRFGSLIPVFINLLKKALS
jgi:AcrR family transcriptional regulator